MVGGGSPTQPSAAALPTAASAAGHDTLRLCTPPPHDTEHAPQAETSYAAIAHGEGLQACVAVGSLHEIKTAGRVVG